MEVEKVILGIDPGTAIMGFGIISVKKNKLGKDLKKLILNIYIVIIQLTKYFIYII